MIVFTYRLLKNGVFRSGFLEEPIALEWGGLGDGLPVLAMDPMRYRLADEEEEEEEEEEGDDAEEAVPLQAS
jgi:hypothetical protein